MAKKAGKTVKTMAVAKQLLRGLLRSQRECSISEYLVLIELANEGGPLSTTALERRLRGPGMKNPRQAVSSARRHRWVVCHGADDGGSEWSLTEEGRAVVAGLLVRLGLTGGFEKEPLAREFKAGQMCFDFLRGVR